jgi:type II secretory pathway component GspD/PulD (secretin)
MFVGLVAGSLAAFAQNTPPADTGSGPAASATTTPATAQPGATGQGAAPAEKPAPPASSTANAESAQAQPAAANSAPNADGAQTQASPASSAPKADGAQTQAASAGSAANADAAQAQPAPATAPAAADVAQAPPAAASSAAPADSNAPAAGASATPQTNAIIPLIVMDDVPLTDAVKNLARQAGLNYMLDPKVAFGQVGPDGKPVPQPTVSIRWENVTAEQALNALLGNYNLQMTEDPKSKIARVTVRDPAAPDPLQTKIIQLKFASPTNMIGAIMNTLTDKRSKVVPDVRTSQLVILATEKELVEVDQLVERLDTITRQVLMEARLLETQVNPTTLKGIDWANTLRNQNFAFGNNLMANSPNNSINNTLVQQPYPKILADTAAGFNPATAFLNADGVSAVLSFLNTYAETKVISAPRTVTLDNEMSTIEVGTMFPIVNTTAGTANTTGGSTVTYSNLTIKLEVTPRISANNYVHLKVVPKVMRLGDLVSSVVGSQNNAVYSFQTREMHTSVLIPSGNTLVLGGLIEDNIHKENSKVPLLGDIPVFSFFFRHDLKQRTKSNLMVFLTPTIVQDEDYQPTKTDFLKTPVPPDSIEGDWSAWDSGKPRDWSKAEPAKDSKFAALPESNKNNSLATIPDESQTAPAGAATPATAGTTATPPATADAKPAPPVQASTTAPSTTAQPSNKFSDVPGVTKE